MPWLQAPFCLHLKARGSWRKATLTAPGATQARIIIKRMFISEEKLLLKWQWENTRFDEIVTQNLGWVVSPLLPLPPAPLLFKVILNQAKGAENKMQVHVGSSGRLPRLRAGPTASSSPEAPATARISISHRPCSSQYQPKSYKINPAPTCCGLRGSWQTLPILKQNQARVGPYEQGPNPPLLLSSCMCWSRSLCHSDLCFFFL